MWQPVLSPSLESMLGPEVLQALPPLSQSYMRVVLVANEVMPLPDLLMQPNGRVVVGAQIPEGVDRLQRVDGQLHDAPMLAHERHFLSVDSALDGLLERLFWR